MYTQYGIEVLNRINERSNKEVRDVIFDAIEYTKENGYNNHYKLYQGHDEAVYVRLAGYDEMVVITINKHGSDHDGWRAPMNPYNTTNHLKRCIKKLVANCR